MLIRVTELGYYLSTINRLVVDKIVEERLTTGRVLDVGCGTGTRVKTIFFTLPAIEIYGCDISPKMIAIASTKNFAGLECCDMQSMPFADESFEVVICLFNVVGYLSTSTQRNRAFREFYRVLKPRGLLFVDFMNRWHLGEGLSFQRSIFTAVKIYLRSLFPSLKNHGNLLFDLQIDGRLIKGFVHGFSCGESKRLLTRNGFDIVHGLTIGYDSGEIKQHHWRGQYFFIARKNTREDE